jgi:hypothetical protein
MPNAARRANATAMPKSADAALGGIAVLAAAAAPVAASAALAPIPPAENAELLALGDRLQSLRVQRVVAVYEERAARNRLNAVGPLRPARSPRKYPHVFFEPVRQLDGGPKMDNGRYKIPLSHAYDQLAADQSAVSHDWLLLSPMGGSRAWERSLFKAAEETGYAPAYKRRLAIDAELGELGQKIFALEPISTNGLAIKANAFLAEIDIKPFLSGSDRRAISLAETVVALSTREARAAR